MADNIYMYPCNTKYPDQKMASPCVKHFTRAIGLLILIFGLFSVPGFAQQSFTGQLSNWQQTQPTGRLIVKYRPADKTLRSLRGGKRFTRSLWRQKHQLKLERSISDTRELLTVANYQRSQSQNSGAQGIREKTDHLRSRARQLTALADVEYASVEYRRYPLQQPNDPLYNGTQTPGNQSYLYEGDFSMRAPGAWDITTGSNDSVIAIVDTGVLPNHPEIVDRSINGLGYDFVSADNPNDYESANDGDGRDADPTDPGDACEGSPSSWHGTSVASVAAGNANNAEGFAGIDWNARMLHARALGICGGTDADIIDAIRWSAGLPVAGVPINPTPANVVNLSLGGATECTKAWQDVIDELAELNIVFVMAAGNETQNALRSAPANCANVITVGANTPAGSVDGGFSNYGLKVTISTIGRGIVVASNDGYDDVNLNGNSYRTETGTSFSAALLSGAISLMHSLDPNLGPREVAALLQESAIDYAGGTNCDLYYCGGGILNLARALTMLRDGTYNPQHNTPDELMKNQSTSIQLQEDIDASLFGYKDIRYYSIAVPERGLLLAESASTEDLFGYLLNSELSVIALDDDNGDSTNFRLASLVDPGTYHIAVERERHRITDGESQFTLSTVLSNDMPVPFTFAPKIDATANSVVQSESVTIEGLTGESAITVSGGFYSLNGGDLVDTTGTVKNGDTLIVAAQSPGVIDTTKTTTITVAAYSTSFSITTSTTDLAFNTGGGRQTSGCSASGNASFDPVMLFLLITAGASLWHRRFTIRLTDSAKLACHSKCNSGSAAGKLPVCFRNY